MLKDRIDNWAAKYPDKFKVYYTVDRATPNWKGGVGFVSDKMITDNMPKPSKDSLVLVCGPPRTSCRLNLGFFTVNTYVIINSYDEAYFRGQDSRLRAR